MFLRVVVVVVVVVVISSTAVLFEFGDLSSRFTSGRLAYGFTLQLGWQLIESEALQY